MNRSPMGRSISRLLIVSLAISLPAANAVGAIISGTYSGIVLSEADGSTADLYNQFGEGNGADLGGQAVSGVFQIDTSQLTYGYSNGWSEYYDSGAAGTVIMTATINGQTMTSTSTGSDTLSNNSGWENFSPYGSGSIAVDLGVSHGAPGPNLSFVEIDFDVNQSSGIDPSNPDSIDGFSSIPFTGTGIVTLKTASPSSGYPAAVIYVDLLTISTDGGALSVPEPSSIVLLVSATVLVTLIRRGRREARPGTML